MAIDRARADLARIEAEVKRLEAQLARARDQAVKLAHYVEMAQLYEAGQEIVSRTSRGTGGRSALAAKMVVDILRDQGRPLHTRQLVEELERRGLTISSTNPVTNLSSALSRSDELVSDRSLGWSLAEWGTTAHTESQADPTPTYETFRSEPLQNHTADTFGDEDSDEYKGL